MAQHHYLARSLHDIGLGLWFGGSTMGAVGLNGAAAAARDPRERIALSHAGWTRWAPVLGAGIAAHLAGSVRLIQTDTYRLRRQEGAAGSAGAKTALTAAALAVTAWSWALNRKLAGQANQPVTGATEPAADTPPEVATAQKQLQAAQWLIPVLTGGITVTTAIQGEQQRPSQVLGGLLST